MDPSSRPRGISPAMVLIRRCSRWSRGPHRRARTRLRACASSRCPTVRESTRCSCRSVTPRMQEGRRRTCIPSAAFRRPRSRFPEAAPRRTDLQSTSRSRTRTARHGRRPRSGTCIPVPALATWRVSRCSSTRSQRSMGRSAGRRPAGTCRPRPRSDRCTLRPPCRSRHRCMPPARRAPIPESRCIPTCTAPRRSRHSRGRRSDLECRPPRRTGRRTRRRRQGRHRRRPRVASGEERWSIRRTQRGGRVPRQRGPRRWGST